MLWTIIGFCSAYGVSSCPFCSSVLTATAMHTKPHLLNARARGLHCVYVSLVCISDDNMQYRGQKINVTTTKSQQSVQQEVQSVQQEGMKYNNNNNNSYIWINISPNSHMTKLFL